MSGRLTDGFRDIIELNWSEFVDMERGLDVTNFDSIIAALVRSCRKGNLRAIQTSLDRLDGKIATEVEVDYPKFYTVYPYATIAADDDSIINIDAGGEVTTPYEDEIIELPVGSPADMDELRVVEDELPTGSIRSVLERMLESPKTQVIDILNAADAVEKGDMSMGNPRVKSVIVAGLMKLVHDGRIAAVFEIFDQIDGKVVDKIKILGNDIFVTSFARIAPAGAVRNEKGIYQIESPNMTNVWAAKLEQGKNNR